MAVGDGVAVIVTVGAGVFVGMGVLVGVSVIVTVGTGVFVGDGVLVGVWVGVWVGVVVGVWVGVGGVETPATGTALAKASAHKRISSASPAAT